MRGAKSAKWVALAAVVALAATACGGNDSDSGSNDMNKGTADPNGILTAQLSEPQNPLQPANAKESQGSRVLRTIFAGLVDYEPGTGKLVYVNAESVTPNKDSSVWTVKLKPGWKFHNGEAVTAKSYVDSWNWSANVANNQTNSSWFQDIKGYEDVHPEKGKPKADKMSGLKVVNDNEFKIELNSSVSYFAYKLGYDVWTPLPSGFFKDPKGFGEKPVGNGPYKFVSWDHKKMIKVRKYDGYKGPNKAKNGGIDFKNYTTADAAYSDLRSNNLDWIEQVPTTALTNYKSDLGKRAIDEEYSAVQSVVPAFYTKQFKDIDPKVIQGLSMAIDRDTITKTVLHGSRTPADSYVARGVIGYKAGALKEQVTYDPAKAKALIKEGGGVPGNKISIQYNADQDHKPWVDAVCNSIRKATGVDCTGDSKPDFQADLNARDKHQVKSMYRGGWVLDYPVNSNFMRDLYGSKAAGNTSGYANKQFDELANKADKAPTLDETVKLYQQAEQILAKDMPAIPLWFYKVNSGQSNKVLGKIPYGQDGDPIFTNVQVKKK
ncbi:peptide ABC transporter substrate-binding protein [Streptomyces rapamycinicus]|uniref:Peptide ABC transporter substrate-binding protein n=2 Tax=Streptomyces rapamycinicus TaxID=1226757 RepID=A0A0A0NE26_STRRN|nr:ABC transporter substrate-binding protein [Streptomyces rapamycinicus]AGP55244.1 peptide ABC transporter substrate-binding protein [Streptomyces rapamycinicus NRRL 5491]MBB4782785.1 oligopeptide transport system substrate-binding protein [Streptomyces rapamycinicus]RLV81734.1 peptide ABC transporter substrate-binding protein [Streptomyces rapamycinicus NRRL 5491]UTO63259.1 ABC transporter substrate-binding protein [Streptomyces rapamycinicus]UTP31217.1 ABC transporter substrate-binding prot